VLLLWAFIKLPRKINLSFASSLFIFAFFIVLQQLNIAKAASQWKLKSDYGDNLSADKSYLFYSKSLIHFFPADIHVSISEAAKNSAEAQTFTYVDPQNFPFLHKDETPDVLSSFFDTTRTRPNIVIIIVEGLGR